MPSEDFDSKGVVLAVFDEVEPRAAPCPGAADVSRELLRVARVELRWFHGKMRGYVPVVGDAPPEEVAAASRICGWLRSIDPTYRGPLVLRYATRRWPARLVRQFGGLTSFIVRFVAMRSPRGPSDTVADLERGVVRTLLEDIATSRGPRDIAEPVEAQLRRWRRYALREVRMAERAYADARGDGPCAVPGAKGGA